MTLLKDRKFKAKRKEIESTSNKIKVKERLQPQTCDDSQVLSSTKPMQTHVLSTRRSDFVCYQQ